MYVIWAVDHQVPILSASKVLAEASTLAEIRDEAVALHDAGRPWADMYLFNEESEELGLSAEWLEEWVAGRRMWPSE